MWEVKRRAWSAFFSRDAVTAPCNGDERPTGYREGPTRRAAPSASEGCDVYVERGTWMYTLGLRAAGNAQRNEARSAE